MGDLDKRALDRWLTREPESAEEQEQIEADMATIPPEMIQHWNRLTFSEALREVYEHYGWEEIPTDPNATVITIKSKKGLPY